MFMEIVRGILIFVGAMTIFVTLAGIALNKLLWGSWTGASQDRRQTGIHEHAGDR